VRTPNILDPWDGVKYWYREEATSLERLACVIMALAVLVLAVNRVTYEPQIVLSKPYQITGEIREEPPEPKPVQDRIHTPDKYKTYVDYTKKKRANYKIRNSMKKPKARAKNLTSEATAEKF